MSATLEATGAALDMIERLKRKYGELMFVQSGGCCDGSSPVCLRRGEMLLGPNDLYLGDIAGCPFYIDRDQYERWRRPQFVVDVAQGAGDTFSLEGAENMQFVALTQALSGGEHSVKAS